MLILLKIPLVYLCMVVWWAIRAEPRDEQPTIGSSRDGHAGHRRTDAPSAVGAARGPACWRQTRLEDAPARALEAARLESRGPLVSSVDETQGDRNTAADTIAGLLAVGLIVLSAIAMGFGLLLQLHAHPARLAPWPSSPRSSPRG